MSDSPTRIADARIYALSVIANPQSELSNVVMNLNFDPRCGRVAESVAQGFARNSVDFITDERRRVPYLPFDGDSKFGRGRVIGETFAECSDSRDQALRNVYRRSQTCTASRPSATASLARSTIRSSSSAASPGRLGIKYLTAERCINRPCTLWSSVSCSSRAIRVRS